MSTISAGKVVSIEYVLTDPSGTEIDRSAEGKPLVYLHGAGNVVPGLEDALDGKSAGDHVSAKVPPEKGYGPKQNIKPRPILRSAFPADVHVAKGSRFVTRGENNEPIAIWVTKVQGRDVYVTPVHPLAGVTLCFEVTVRDVRDATDEEKAHGHVHAPGAHGHGEHEHE